nr:hypothetical protein [Alphaproteobacteria bacterium]
MKLIYTLIAFCFILSATCVEAVSTRSSARNAASEANKAIAVNKATNDRVDDAKFQEMPDSCIAEYDACMDTFCRVEDEAGRCFCSNQKAKFDTRLKKAEDDSFDIISKTTDKVNSIQRGNRAEYIKEGTNEGEDVKGRSTNTTSAASTALADLVKSFSSGYGGGDEDLEVDMDGGKASMRGSVLLQEMKNECFERGKVECQRHKGLLELFYSKKVATDCTKYEKIIVKREKLLQTQTRASAQAVRAAVVESFDSTNLYNRGECMVKFKGCMQSSAGCGNDFANCPTLTNMASKQYICDTILDKCVAHKDTVFTDFWADVESIVKKTKARVDQDFKLSCLSQTITCIVDKCSGATLGEGSVEYELCLMNRELAFQTCSSIMDPCSIAIYGAGKASGSNSSKNRLWDTVGAKLSVMANSACETAVQGAIDEKCGDDMKGCLGLGYLDLKGNGKDGEENGMVDATVMHLCKDDKTNMEDIDEGLKQIYESKHMTACYEVYQSAVDKACGFDETGTVCESVPATFGLTDPYSKKQMELKVTDSTKPASATEDAVISYSVEGIRGSDCEDATSCYADFATTHTDILEQFDIMKATYAVTADIKLCKTGLSENSLTNGETTDADGNVTTDETLNTTETNVDEALKNILVETAKRNYNQKLLAVYAEKSKKDGAITGKADCE